MVRYRHIMVMSMSAILIIFCFTLVYIYIYISLVFSLISCKQWCGRIPCILFLANISRTWCKQLECLHVRRHGTFCLGGEWMLDGWDSADGFSWGWAINCQTKGIMLLKGWCFWRFASWMLYDWCSYMLFNKVQLLDWCSYMLNRINLFFCWTRTMSCN